MSDSMKVRFAPSPTGALHVGGARAALYNWLLARGNGGTFVLRIEDTDRERSTPENIEQILDALRWLELDYDEGPFFQSERGERHKAEIARLVDEGHAYLDEGAVRLRVPDEGQTVVPDLIRGEITFQHKDIADFVIARSDGSPLYNLAVAVDDHDMGITHVIRGEDHISNTPRQMMILKALSADTPVYAHLPLLHGPDGKKLSKRHGAASVQELRDAGYLPEAVDNYIALLGAGFAADEEHFSLNELAERFRLDRVSKNPAVFDERKLRHMNGRWLRELSLDELTARLERYTGRTGLRDAVAIAADKIQTYSEFWPLVSFLFDGPSDDQAAFQRVICADGGVETLKAARAALARAEPFNEGTVEQALRQVVEATGAKPGKVYQPIRVAIAGGTVSPGIFESVALLGREQTLARIDQALERAASRNN
jgi:glutamyl-tRNA synthetase